LTNNSWAAVVNGSFGRFWSFADRRANGEVAPVPDLPGLAPEREVRFLCKRSHRNSLKLGGLRFDDGRCAGRAGYAREAQVRFDEQGAVFRLSAFAPTTTVEHHVYIAEPPPFFRVATRRRRAGSALHQFDADTIGRGDVAQEAAIDTSFQLDRETNALAAQLGAECFEVALIEEAEMIGPPRVMARKVCVLSDRPGGGGVLARPLAADQDRHAAQIDKDLRGAARHRIRGNRRAEDLGMPVGRRFRVFTDYVHVIEFECGIAHHLPSRRDRRRRITG